MDLSIIWTAGIFVHLALLFYVLGFMIRDELWLRALILVGTGFYILYYYFAADAPLWDAIFASGVIGTVNIVMILVIMRERSTFGMSAEMLSIYRSFPTLSPGQFRRIMSVAERRTITQSTPICDEGVAPGHLFFVISGEMTLDRKGEKVRAAGGSFVGEISFLLDGPASATVVLEEGSQYLAWPRPALRRMMRRSDALANALAALFNRDLAGKLSRSMPREYTR